MSDAVNQEPFMSPHPGMAPNISVGHPSWGPSCPQGPGQGGHIGTGPGLPPHPAFVNMYPNPQSLVTPMDGQPLYHGPLPSDSLYPEDKRHDELGNTQHFLELSGHHFNSDTPEDQVNYHLPMTERHHQQQQQHEQQIQQQQQHQQLPSYYPYCQDSSITSSISSLVSENNNSTGVLLNKTMVDKDHSMMKNTDYFRRPDFTGNKPASGMYSPASSEWKPTSADPTMSPHIDSLGSPKQRFGDISKLSSNHEERSNASNKSSLSQINSPSDNFGGDNEPLIPKSRTSESNSTHITKNMRSLRYSSSCGDLLQTKRSSQASETTALSSSSCSLSYPVPSNSSSDAGLSHGCTSSKSSTLVHSASSSNLNTLLSLCRKPEVQSSISSASSSSSTNFNIDSQSGSIYTNNNNNSNNNNKNNSNNKTSSVAHSTSNSISRDENKARQNQADLALNITSCSSGSSTGTTTNNNSNNPITPDNFLHHQEAGTPYNLNFEPATKSSSPPNILDTVGSNHDKNSLPPSSYAFYPATDNTTVTSMIPALTTAHTDIVSNQSSGIPSMSSLAFPSREEDGTVMDFGQLQRQAAELSLDFMSKDIILPPPTAQMQQTPASDMSRDTKICANFKHTPSTDTSNNARAFMTQVAKESNNSTDISFSPELITTPVPTIFQQQQSNRTIQKQEVIQEVLMSHSIQSSGEREAKSRDLNTDRHHNKLPNDTGEIYSNSHVKKLKSSKKLLTNLSNSCVTSSKNDTVKRKPEELPDNAKPSSKKVKAGNRAH